MVEEAAAAFLSNDAETDAASLPPSAHFNVPTGGQVEAGRSEREGMNFAQGRISCHGKSRLKFREIEFDETPCACGETMFVFFGAFNTMPSGPLCTPKQNNFGRVQDLCK